MELSSPADAGAGTKAIAAAASRSASTARLSLAMLRLLSPVAVVSWGSLGSIDVGLQVGWISTSLPSSLFEGKGRRRGR
jgi:hypothetical protein